LWIAEAARIAFEIENNPRGKNGEKVVQLMEGDPHLVEQKIEADLVQTIGYMHFCRNTLLDDV